MAKMNAWSKRIGQSLMDFVNKYPLRKHQSKCEDGSELSPLAKDADVVRISSGRGYALVFDKSAGSSLSVLDMNDLSRLQQAYKALERRSRDEKLYASQAHEQCRVLIDEINSLKEHQSVLTEENTKLRSNIASLEDEIQVLKFQITSFRARESERLHIDTMKNQLDSLKQSENGTRIFNLQKELDEHREMLKYRETSWLNDRKSLHAEIEELKLRLQDLSSAEGSFQRLSSLCSHVEESCQSMISRARQFLAAFRLVQRQHSELQNEIVKEIHRAETLNMMGFQDECVLVFDALLRSDPDNLDVITKYVRFLAREKKDMDAALEILKFVGNQHDPANRRQAVSSNILSQLEAEFRRLRSEIGELYHHVHQVVDETLFIRGCPSSAHRAAVAGP
mmetsp:Transcript_72182/g.192987  ORF Transcript_72182/g.192987 Transcript_72182/m.192987 type:complete len:394 (-) Transcript_72182:1918-3099(-)